MNKTSGTDCHPEEDTQTYYCVFLTIAKHPRKPLNGNQLAISGEIPDGLLDFDELADVHDEVADRFDLDAWQTDVYVARLYLTEDGLPAGIKWEDTPQLYEHGLESNPIHELPDDLDPVE